MNSFSNYQLLACLFVVSSCERSPAPEDTHNGADIVVDTSLEVNADGGDHDTAPLCDSSVAPEIGCPCQHTAGLHFCCTRYSNGMNGWSCDGGKWYRYYHNGCDGNPADCPCPLCPIEWEPEWWSPPPGFDPP